MSQIKYKMHNELRKNYINAIMKEESINPDPFRQFADWFDQAVKAKIQEPNAMALATIDNNGNPAVRMVLLKDYGQDGFTFFTNYDSRKGLAIQTNPHVACTFWWGSLERQIRIEGKAQKIPAANSDLYFESRPEGSKLGAHCSNQSQIIENYLVLEERYKDLEKFYMNKKIPRPENWGGYKIIPSVMEFWQGRSNRLHDRFRYTKMHNGSWKIDRLSP